LSDFTTSVPVETETITLLLQLLSNALMTS